jgi:hypothetical protein
MRLVAKRRAERPGNIEIAVFTMPWAVEIEPQRLVARSPRPANAGGYEFGG